LQDGDLIVHGQKGHGKVEPAHGKSWGQTGDRL